MDEKKLIKKAMRGNVKAYGLLMEEYQEVLYRTAFLHVKNKETALDMVSETVIRGYESVKKLRQPEYFKTWLIRILLNQITDYFRKSGREISLDTWEAETVIPQEVPITSAALEQHLEEKMDLAAALDCLPEKQRSVMILKYYNEMKISEIAEILEMPEGTVKAYLHAAKAKMREFLKEDYLYV